jgi:Galactose-3-O-sulfotransferase
LNGNAPGLRAHLRARDRAALLSRGAIAPQACKVLRLAGMNHKALIFLHIHKTAGTTLNRILDWQYNPFSIFTIDPYNIRATADRFKSLPEQRRRRLEVVRGHLFYGIHKYLPQGGNYITMLREPVARLLSTYYFILRRPLHPLHWKFKNERLGVRDLIRLTPNRQNLQCKFIAGVGRIQDVEVQAQPGQANPENVSDERLLEIAKQNLSRSFRVVGLTERFQESLLLMATQFHWRIPFYEKRKVSKTRKTIEPGLVDFIREQNRLDVELYEFGKRLFENNLRENGESIRAAMTSQGSMGKPGVFMRSWYSIAGNARFLTSKIASVL